MDDTVVVDSCIRGHHISQSFWTPRIGETLSSEREEGNTCISDPYVVPVSEKVNARIIGHIPRKISAACSLFLGREESTISCIVSGNRRYSSDLPQGGLED